MTPRQRRFHARLWPILAVTLLAAITALTLARPARLVPEPQAGGTP